MLESCQGRGLMQGHCAGMNFSLSHTSGRSPRDQHTVDPSLRSTSGSGLGLWLSSLGQLTRCMFLGCFGFRGWGLRILKAAGAGQLYIYVSQTRDVDASTFCKDKLDVETFLVELNCDRAHICRSPLWGLDSEAPEMSQNACLQG